MVQGGLTRRTLLKGGGALAAALALSKAIPAVGGSALAESTAGAAGAAGATGATGEQGDHWVKSFCGSCIWTNCGTEVHVQNGIATEVRGNLEHPANQGTLCPRGAAQLMNLYNPYRFKAPLKRTNPEKGLDVDPGWQEISWDEALDTVYEKLAAVRDSDPRRFMIMYGFAGNLHEGPFVKLFTAIFGTPNYSMSCGPLCEVHHAPSLYNMTFVDRIDLGYCNYLITFGRNVGASAAFASGPARAFTDACERGMHNVVFDPHANMESTYGEWVPTRPGSDMAIAMAMIHVMLHELDTFDREFVTERTNAPYLITPEGDYLRDPNSDKPLIWDEAAGQALAFDDPNLSAPALTGTYEVNGVKAQPAFEKIKASVAEATPEWAEERSTVPAATIRRITAEFVEAACIGATIELEGRTYPYRPAVIAVGRGSANNMQGLRFYCVADLLNCLVGAMGVPGSLVHAAGPKFVIEDGMMREYPVSKYTTDLEQAFSIPQNDFTGKQFSALARFPVFAVTLGAILDPAKYYLDYDIDVLFPYGCNPFMNDSNRELVVEAFKKVPFVFTCGYHMDETSQFCDIILPEHAHLERHQVRPIEETMAVGKDTIKLAGMNYKEPAVELLYNTRQFEDVITTLAYRLGYGPRMNQMYNLFCKLGEDYALDPTSEYSYAEMLEARLTALTQDKAKGSQWFREQGFYATEVPVEQCYDYAMLEGARLPLYNWRDWITGQFLKRNMERFDVEMPGWEGRMEEVYREYTAVPAFIDNFLTEPNDEYNLFVCNWKISPRNLGLGGQDDNVWLREVVEQLEFDDLRIQINPATAAAHGLEDGDTIIVESQHGGTTSGQIKVTGLVHPEVLGFPSQAGRVAPGMNPISKHGTSYNQLLNGADGFYFAESGSIAVGARVKIRKA
jgi:anaerobic selenocysteine-containing dehydrogenase